MQLALLVKSAVGFDEARGDTVDVVNLQFAALDVPLDIEEGGFGLGNVDVMKVLEIIVLGFVAVLVVMLVLRPLVSRLLNAPPGMPMAPLPAMGGEVPAAIAPPPEAPAPVPEAPAPAPAPFIEPEEDTLIDIARVDGRVSQSRVRKIGEIVDKHPSEALNILRNWLYAE